MSWTYSGDPAASSLDMVRFLIQDTDNNDHQLSNEEIAAMLALHTNVYVTAAACAEILAAQFARKADKTVGDLSISYSQASKNYRDLVQQLRSKASIEAAAPYAGGISVSDKQTDEEDSDRVAPAFKIGGMDFVEPTEEISED